MSFEEKMKQDLKKDLEIPEIVEQKIQDAYKEIGQGKLRMKKPDNRNQKRKKVWTAAAAAVAVIAISGTVLYSNPVSFSLQMTFSSPPFLLTFSIFV